MRSFSFPLRRALDWRRAQLDAAEAQLRRLAAAIAELERAAARLELAGGRAEDAVRRAPAVEAGDLWALAGYRQRLRQELGALAARRAAAGREMEAQRGAVLEARRQCRLLEKLEQRRRAEWSRQAGRELESLAAESFLAAWTRRRD